MIHHPSPVAHPDPALVPRYVREFVGRPRRSADDEVGACEHAERRVQAVFADQHRLRSGPFERNAEVRGERGEQRPPQRLLLLVAEPRGATGHQRRRRVHNGPSGAPPPSCSAGSLAPTPEAVRLADIKAKIGIAAEEWNIRRDLEHLIARKSLAGYFEVRDPVPARRVSTHLPRPARPRVWPDPLVFRLERMLDRVPTSLLTRSAVGPSGGLLVRVARVMT